MALCSIVSFSYLIVFIYGSPDALHVSDLKNTTLFVGPVKRFNRAFLTTGLVDRDRSLLIDRCFHCTFAIACQQVLIFSR